MHQPWVPEPPPSPLKSVNSEKKRQDAKQGIDLGHPGGAIYQCSGHGTVDIVCTKNRKFPLPEAKKYINLSQNLTIKYENENAERLPPLQSTIESQIDGDFCRFLVALVDLSEPLSYDGQMDQIEPKPGN